MIVVSRRIISPCKGAIQLGVVNQSYAAFNHILSDLSLIVNQFEALSQFTAGVDRLGEFAEFLERRAEKLAPDSDKSRSVIDLRTVPASRVEVHGEHLIRCCRRMEPVELSINCAFCGFLQTYVWSRRTLLTDFCFRTSTSALKRARDFWS
eukprot:Plantae.Rhodophyta-Purpureofilum_apyrenoidigerum.ctg25104.p1 GENE.Plantae.Rhodophyta-Purpureofilum_apyrenoidigerum.ctg25104~~Plantae.Rhodophyta-Purpureofilum_apyrenoidigerum.ctg25104.p1  ORF type:complete len:151 (+),score=2.23 Plantae.Rhodophyta-Purpureofilum_apyrenoidigerum.ctg25104:1493-1945(+)